MSWMIAAATRNAMLLLIYEERCAPVSAILEPRKNSILMPQLMCITAPTELSAEVAVGCSKMVVNSGLELQHGTTITARYGAQGWWVPYKCWQQGITGVV